MRYIYSSSACTCASYACAGSESVMASNDSSVVDSSVTSSAVQEQLDEVQLLEAMMGRDGEFEWRQEENGCISGRLQVFLRLERELVVSVARRERKVTFVDHAHPPGRQASLARADSASTSPMCATVAHLPLVSLHFELPPDYPQRTKPYFTLTCSWLNFTQLTKLCRHLDTLWDSDPGSVVLYNWHQFLSCDLLSALDVSSELVLRFEDPASQEGDRDQRAVQEMRNASLMIPFLLDYDKREREREFADSLFDCEICFSSLLGSRCRRVKPCGHIHCCECLRLYVTSKVGSGDVAKIECPSNSCKESLSLNLIRELVSPEIFERFDRLLLQKTLDKMTDVVYCPRPTCQCVTLREEDDTNMAQCPRCRFSFCILCKHAWHGVEPCKLLPQDLKELRETWESLGTEEREVLEKQYGKSKLEKAFQEQDSMAWLDTNARKCPNCQAKIEKTLGCNKMTCTHCSASFCWLCSAPLPSVDPYKHFRPGQSNCAGKLFEGITDSDDEDFWF